MIDLRSDTVTKPTLAMLDAMMSAKVGDDVFIEDPTVLELENLTAKKFGKEAGIFCPSGTMTNQIAIKLHTQPGHEVICDNLSHIYNYEGGGIAVNSLCSVKLMHGDRGRFTAEDVSKNIQPDDIHAPITSLVSIENTSNKGGGACWNENEIEKIAKLCKEKGLAFHLDGARVFNATITQGLSTIEMGKHFDTISICLSKGLGAPVGSVLIGSKEQIKQARRIRKVLGGGMRQVGILAAAGIYALNNHVDRLAEDHKRARKISETLSSCTYVTDILKVETNIVVFDIDNRMTGAEYLHKLKDKGVLGILFGPQRIRLTTHLDFNDDQLEQLCSILSNIS